MLISNYFKTFVVVYHYRRFYIFNLVDKRLVFLKFLIYCLNRSKQLCEDDRQHILELDNKLSASHAFYVADLLNTHKAEFVDLIRILPNPINRGDLRLIITK